MSHATAETVLGDFSGIEYRHFETTSTFYQEDDGFFVRTDGADGELREFRIAYTFGVDPLQQYLVEFPDGRLQTLPIAWDARSAEAGGQRWFHIYPDEAITSDDALHWTGREQNWNYMCAECHSTNLAKNYDLVSDTFDTSWFEINVACEACHGPASTHIAQAEAGEFLSRHGLLVDLDDAGRAVWEMNSDTGIAVRSELRMRAPAQPEACGRCHSRRSVVTADYEFDTSLLDTHMPALLDDVLYFPDGQIREEVYVYGSFLQSRMYQAGVSCSDCHEPHSGELRTGSNPNDICSTCHLPAKFATSAHHNHEVESAGCVDCHMASRDYMVVDGRRDHSFRIPQPELTVVTGSPNACSGCHVDQDAEWALAATRDWYGDREQDHYGFAIHAARSGAIGGNDLLLGIVSDNSVAGIVKGTALAELRSPYSRDVAQSLQTELGSPDPYVRLGALRALPGLPQEAQIQLAAPLLQDRVRSIRIEAARGISPLRTLLPPQYASAFSSAEQEMNAAMHAIAERPEAHGNLGNTLADAGEPELAIAEFQVALQMDSRAVGPRSNLADLYRRLERDADAEDLLREGIAIDPDAAALHHSLGLLLVRQQRPESGLDALRIAAQKDSANSRYLYVYAVALNSLGQSGDAIDLLQTGKDRFPADFDIQWALATMLRDQGQMDAAREIAVALALRYPEIGSVNDLLNSL
jgi:tetratricopeptide (TPR) repeat protein